MRGRGVARKVTRSSGLGAPCNGHQLVYATTYGQGHSKKDGETVEVEIPPFTWREWGRTSLDAEDVEVVERKNLNPAKNTVESQWRD